MCVRKVKGKWRILILCGILVAIVLLIAACSVAKNEAQAISTAANAANNAQNTAVVKNNSDLNTAAASFDNTQEAKYNEDEMNRIERIGKTAVAQGTQVVQIPDDGVRFVRCLTGNIIPLGMMAGFALLGWFIRVYCLGY